MRFGRFELRLDADVLLTLDGREVHVQPQPLRLLRILVEHAGEVVTRETLRRALWDASTFVEFDQSLNYCIRHLRIALHDDAARPVYIETVKRQGYRFRAPVESAAAPGAPASTAAPRSTDAGHGVALPEMVPVRLRTARWLTSTVVAGMAGVIVLLVVLASTRLTVHRVETAAVSYRQLTNFSEAAFAPALSPDGRMLAFIVGTDASFPPSGEVYVKLLPRGEPLQLTRDGWPKYGPAFSPDGAELAYTVNDAAHGWSTRAVSPLGGDSRLLLDNASGLVWLDERRLMFAEIITGLHMGLVTAAADRSARRSVYLPPHERGMAHFGRPSPDGRSALVVEMGATGAWQRCRLVPLDGHDAGRPVGPDGACTAAAWSPDGTQMYFTAWMDGQSHIWRQSSTLGDPMQVTRGPTDEQGLAMSGDGRTVVTSIGMIDSGVWMHDGSGDHLLLQEGTAAHLAFSRDGRLLYYLVRSADQQVVQLRAMDTASHVSRPVVSGLAITSYDLADDGGSVVMSVRGADGGAQLWTASTDGQMPPRQLAVDGDAPCFGPGGSVYFRRSENGKNYLFRMAADGTTAEKARETPVLDVKGASPDRRWVLAVVPVDGVLRTAVVALSTDSTREVRVCPAMCMAAWSPDGSRFYVEPLLQGDAEGRVVVEVPVTGDGSLPALPAAGIASAANATLLPGARRIDIARVDLTRVGTNVTPGPAAGSFAYARSISRRNLFEVQLP